MISGECQCGERCGRPATCNGPQGTVISDSCWQRWRRAGKPDEVPPGRPPREPEPEPDPEEWDVEPDPVEVAARWGWVDPELRRQRAIPAAAELVRLVHHKDRQGLEILMSRFTDWGALAVVLAGWVDPVKTASRKTEAA